MDFSEFLVEAETITNTTYGLCATYLRQLITGNHKSGIGWPRLR